MGYAVELILDDPKAEEVRTAVDVIHFRPVVRVAHFGC
jgi:hypothetical protein